MQKVKIGKGVRFLFDERVFEIVEELLDQNYRVKDLNFGEERLFTHADILQFLSSGQLRFEEIGKNTTADRPGFSRSRITDISDLPDDRREEARFRYEAIKPLLLVETGLNKQILQRVEELKVSGHKASRASLYRWLKAWKESNGNYLSLLSNYEKCGPKDTKIRKEVEVIIDEQIQSYYLKREAVTMETVYEMVVHQIAQKNKFRAEDDQLVPPSLATVRRRILERDVHDLTKARHGAKHAFDKYGEVKIFEKPRYPLQRVECDHTRLDLFVVDDERRLPIGRPTITTLLDVFSGYPLGVYIGFEPPSYTSVMHALKHAIFPKDYVKSKFPDVQNGWMAYGLPEMLVVDNGKEFLGRDLEDVCLQLNIELERCPPKKSWYKGSVERHFRTINQQLLHQTPGTTFSNVIAKKDYNPKKNAVVGFTAFLELFHIWLLDYYATKFQRGVRGVPMKLWQEMTSKYVPSVPSFMPDLEIILRRTEYGTIQRTGIQFKHLFYQSEDLWRLRNKKEAQGGDKRVKFKFDPTDISIVHVYDETRQAYIAAPCTDQQYSKGLSFYTHKAIVKMLRDEAKEVDIVSLSAAKAKMIELMQREWRNTRGVRRDIARHKGIGSDKVFADKPMDFNQPDLQESSVKEQTAKVRNAFEEQSDDGDWGGVYAG